MIGGLPSIPSNTGRGLPSTCSSTGDGAHCCRGGWLPCVLFFQGGGQNERDLHPIHRYRWWRELLEGGVVPTSLTRELYVQGSQEHQRLGSNPRTGRLKTDALTTGPRESLPRLRGAVGYVSSPEDGAVRCEACCACREAPVYVYGAGTGGPGAGWGAAPSDRRLTCTGVRGGQ